MSRARLVLLIYVALVVTALLSGVILMASGWWPAIPRDAIGFGATPMDCQTAYGVAEDAKNAPGMDSAQNLFYGKHLWNVLVGFDAAGRAEMFVFYKARFSPLPLANLTSAEQKALLDKFANGGTWVWSAGGKDGPEWRLEDQQALAFYIPVNRCLVIMNRQCVERKERALEDHAELERPAKGTGL